MNTTARTPSTIGSKKFRIPLYQRPYAWEKDEVIQLLDDLYETFQNTRDAYYHIGILSVAKTSDDQDRDDLIDGQQRITTLLLIGKAAKEYWSGWDAFLTRDRLDLYGRKGDQNYLDYDIETEECNRKMVTAVDLAKEFLKTHDNAEDFSQYIYERAAFFIAEVPHCYSLMDKNQQFVRMNNRGKQLEKHEILKVKLIRRGDKNAEDKAFAAWNRMVRCLTGIDAETDDPTKDLKGILDEDKGDDAKEAGTETFYNSIVSVPEFLLIALARYCLKHGKGDISHNEDKLIETFSEKLLKGDVAAVSDAVGAFMGILEKQVLLLNAFFIYVRRGGEKDGVYVLGMTDKDAESSFDFGESSKGEKRLIAIQSFLHVSTTPHHWLIPAFDWCSQFLDGKVDWEHFVKKLEEIDNDLIRERNVSHFSVLESMTYPTVSYYWFYRLDYELLKNVDDDVWTRLPDGKEVDERVMKLIRDFRFRKCGSVEHIIPQNRIDQSPRAEPDHSFGNLALISSSRNSKFSNNLPDGKMAIILGSSDAYAESLKMLHFLWWNPNADSEGERMHNILLKAVKGHLPANI